MSINDPTDPWLNQASNFWPLEEQHYAEVFTVSASFSTDDPPLWSGLLSPSACVTALRETGDIASTATKASGTVLGPGCAHDRRAGAPTGWMTALPTKKQAKKNNFDVDGRSFIIG